MSSLLKLTADYTDSEDEDNKDEAQNEISNPPSNARMSSRASSSNLSPTGSRAGSLDLGVNSATGTPVKKPSLNKLVSYGDPDEEDNENSSSPNKKNDSSVYEDADMRKESDEEQDRNEDNDSESNQAVPMDLGTTDEEDNKDEDTEKPKNDNLEMSAISERGVEVEAWTVGGQLPPEPPGQCDPKLQEMVNRAYKKTKEEGYDMNATIQNKKKFRNPSIYERLIEFCDIDEMGTNFPKDLYDGHLYGPESYYDQLAKEQNAALEKQRKAAEKRKAEVPVLKSSSSAPVLTKDGGEAAKRRSKWDQGGNQVAVPPATLIGNSNAAAAAAVAAQVAKKISSIGPLRRI